MKEWKRKMKKTERKRDAKRERNEKEGKGRETDNTEDQIADAI